FGSLLLVEVTVDMDFTHDPIEPAVRGFAVGAVTGVHPVVVECDAGVSQVPAFAVGIHSQGHGGARAERGQQELVRIGGAVATARGFRFVGGPTVASGG